MKRLHLIIKSVAFIVLLLFMLSLANRYLAYHQSSVRSRLNKIYEEDTPLEVVIIGGSHAGRTINPEIISNVLDADAITLFTPGQRFQSTYLILEELFKEREAKLIVYEMYTLLHPSEGLMTSNSEKSFFRIRDVFNEIPFSLNKIELVAQAVEPRLFIELLVPIINSHNNWKNLSEIKSNFEYRYDPEDYGLKASLLGTLSNEDAYIYKNEDYYHEYQYTDGNRLWMEKIIELIEENDSKLLVVMAPVYQPFLEHSNFSEVCQRIEKDFNKMGVPYLDMNSITDLGHDAINILGESALKKDQIEKEKVLNNNINGNQHVSHIGSYNATQFLIPYVADMVGYEEYDWSKNQYDITSYLAGLDYKGKIVIASNFNAEKAQMVEGYDEALAHLEVEPELFENYRAGFICLDYRDSNLAKSASFSDTVTDITFEEREDLNLPFDLSIQSQEEKSIRTIVNNQPYDASKDGLMILVYDPEKGEVCDRAFFEPSISPIRYIW